MVASLAIASKVSLETLKRGGNAVDAAAVVALALAVTYPSASNIGSGGFMMIRMAEGRTAIDYREAAPPKASHDIYLDKNEKLAPSGYFASGFPGTVAGLSLALSKYGAVSWADDVEPARKIAVDGFPVNYPLAGGLARSRQIAEWPEGKRIFRRFYEEAEILKLPNLARTHERLKPKGPCEFYEGKTAELIDANMSDHGGLISLDDLKNYKAVEREPLKGSYRGYHLMSMLHPSSVGVAPFEMLNILEHFPIVSMGPDSDAKDHLVIEAMGRAFADRDEFLGDPDFVHVPVPGLISKRQPDSAALGY
jgi:gamma-glutamyltranspeptidase/glutathione hydrolase